MTEPQTTLEIPPMTKTIQERLAPIDLSEDVIVPKRLAGVVENKETLEGLSSLSIIGEAQLVLRLLVPAGTATHDEGEDIIEPIVGVGNYYTLCHNPLEVAMLTPEDKLKMLGIFGGVYAGKGLPVVSVSVSKALSPAVAPDPVPTRYITIYLDDRNATDRFFKAKKDITDNQDHKRIIIGIWSRLKAKRYEGATPGCIEPTPKTHPIHEEFDPNKTWAAEKPVGYTPRVGSDSDIVWSCHQQ